MYMQEKLGKARGIIYAVALAAVAILFGWELLTR
jgi:hypothetical protein